LLTATGASFDELNIGFNIRIRPVDEGAEREEEDWEDTPTRAGVF